LHQEETTITPQVVAFLLADTSGSMAGSKSAAAANGVQDVRDALQDNDLFSLLTFSDKVQRRALFQKKPTFPWHQTKGQIMECGNGTCFYDAVLEAIQFMKSSEKPGIERIFELIAITDGEDTCSKASLEEVSEAIAHPGLRNFNFVLITVGISKSLRDLYLSTLCSRSIQHSHLIDVASDGIAGAFKDASRRVKRHRQLRIEVLKGALVDPVQLAKSLGLQGLPHVTVKHVKHPATNAIPRKVKEIAHPKGNPASHCSKGCGRRAKNGKNSKGEFWATCCFQCSQGNGHGPNCL